LADVLPKVTVIAKELATAMTSENTRRKDLQGKDKIFDKDVNNNKSVRGALVKSNVYPKSLPLVENIKKLKSRHKK